MNSYHLTSMRSTLLALSVRVHAELMRGASRGPKRNGVRQDSKEEGDGIWSGNNYSERRIKNERGKSFEMKNISRFQIDLARKYCTYGAEFMDIKVNLSDLS